MGFMIAFWFLLVCASGFAQQTLRLWKGKDISAKEKWTKLTVFRARQDTSGIAVIICPGGSYIYLDRINEGASVARKLNSCGITAFVLRYRTAWQRNRHPAMIKDLQKSICYVREHAEKYGIDAEKVGVMGFSAGGHLAGTSAVYADSSFIEDCGSGSLRPYFAAMIYPVVSMEDEICHKKSRKNLLGEEYPVELQSMMSLEKNVPIGMPPVFLLHCTGDKTVDYKNSLVFDAALTEKGVAHRFMLIEEHRHGGHGFGVQPIGKVKGWINHFVEWLLDLRIPPTA
ncbi:MAG: alpha/beta hydrolase [Bacteroides sp.]|nr:alpha/beta hydrolase [Bacteroides sp.]MCM1084867.1 alpha/beta hydrolase [Bacteroides sp.]